MASGILSGLKRHAIHDGDGLRTTVFFKGCPLKCVWCHNPESLSFKPETGFYPAKCLGCGECLSACPQEAIRLSNGLPAADSVACTGCGQCAEACPANARIHYGQRWEASALIEKLMADLPFWQASGGGVTLSGGECLAQPAFAVEVARLLHTRGVSVFVDTCGFVPPQVLEQIIPYTDCFLYDIKAVDPAVHKRCTGQENRLILDNLRLLSQRGCRIEVRYPYVPGWNDAECPAIGQFLSRLSGIGKVKVLGYHALADGKYAALGLEDTLPKAHVIPADVELAVQCLKSYGLNAINGMEAD